MMHASALHPTTQVCMQEARGEISTRDALITLQALGLKRDTALHALGITPQEAAPCCLLSS